MVRSSPQRRPMLVFGVVALVLAGLGWRFPLFHVVSLKAARQQQPAAFDAAAFAGRFWEEKLLPATVHAADLKELLAVLSQNPGEARKRFGRSLGMSSTTAVFVKGSGRVTAVDSEEIRVAVDGAPDGSEIRIGTGLLFGNAVRDGTGLLDVSAYADSQDFNNLSTELNRIVEEKLFPALRTQAAVGKRIQFAGCAEFEETATPGSLQIVPVKVEWP